jgi:serine/threonine protein kinase
MAEVYRVHNMEQGVDLALKMPNPDFAQETVFLHLFKRETQTLAPTPQSDIYLHGIVFTEMLSGGERPFTDEDVRVTGTTAEKIRWKPVNLRPPSPRQFNWTISPGLKAVVPRFLEKDSALRFA